MINRLLNVTICIIVMAFSASAQSADALDRKNGFNVFILGSDLKDISRLAKLKKVDNISNGKNLVRYTIKNINEYHIFDYMLQKIHLLYYKDELLEIQLYLPDHSSMDRDRNLLISQDIFKRIEDQYGRFKARDLSTQDKLNDVTECGEIVGRDVTLLFTNFKPLTADPTTYRGICYTFISARVYNMQLTDNKKESGL
jgi:hypothetical protein